jgi:hypothetical protein
MLSGQKEYDIVEAHTIECKGSQQALAEFMVPSIKASRPGPEAAKHPKTITLPLPCLTVGIRVLPWNSVFGFSQT